MPRLRDILPQLFAFTPLEEISGERGLLEQRDIQSASVRGVMGVRKGIPLLEVVAGRNAKFGSGMMINRAQQARLPPRNWSRFNPSWSFVAKNPTLHTEQTVANEHILGQEHPPRGQQPQRQRQATSGSSVLGDIQLNMPS